MKPISHTPIHLVLATLASAVRQEKKISNVTIAKEETELSSLS